MDLPPLGLVTVGGDNSKKVGKNGRRQEKSLRFSRIVPWINFASSCCLMD